ncbi:hypothetical protein SASPL_110039 [Salvia splendens]|uniref:PGG domain-containing protein n=1 Tax=Salvia splendens TaxID=180675 RepID=A0A8X9A3U5_SALSN|nr:hypothetical protein SASPL_110039 [Salvia splendens]
MADTEARLHHGGGDQAFQAVVSPTGGVWQEDTPSHKAGEAVIAYKDPRSYRNFIRSNTVAFVTSYCCSSLAYPSTPHAQKGSLSRVIQLAIAAWVGLMTVLLVANIIRQL